MTTLNPNDFREKLNATLTRFVGTSSPVNGIRTPRLAAEIRKTIGELQFVKGPYVETLPDFQKGGSLADLCAEGVLQPQWRAFSDNAPSVWNRKLHAHQDEAIRRTDNYLVATGTGSGKTESFLYPLIDDCPASAPLTQNWV